MLIDINEDSIIRIGDMLEDLVSSTKEVGEKIENIKFPRPPSPVRVIPLDNLTLDKEWRIKRYKEYIMFELKKFKEYESVPGCNGVAGAKDMAIRKLGGSLKECQDLDKLKDCLFELIWEDGCQYILRKRQAGEEE